MANPGDGAKARGLYLRSVKKKKGHKKMAAEGDLTDLLFLVPLLGSSFTTVVGCHYATTLLEVIMTSSSDAYLSISAWLPEAFHRDTSLRREKNGIISVVALNFPS